MTDRQQQILQKVILDYISTGVPVGSSKLSEFFDLSSATLRNEMATLENEGYLYQPHTSAGRIPTEIAYHHYIAHGLEGVELSGKEKERLMENVIHDPEGIDVKGLAKTMSKLSVQTVIVAFRENDVFYTGISHLFSQPEFQDPQTILKLSSVLDDLNEAIEKVFQNVGTDVEIFVGESNPFGKKCSTLATKYESEKGPSLLAILGPTRMEYDYNISLLEFCRDILNSKGKIKN